MKKFKAEIYIGLIYSVVNILVWYFTIRLDSPLNISDDASQYTYVRIIIDFVTLLLLSVLFKRFSKENLKYSIIVPLISAPIISYVFFYVKDFYSNIGFDFSFILIFNFIYIFIIDLLTISLLLIYKKTKSNNKIDSDDILDSL
jgi:hypothetical protein